MEEMETNWLEMLDTLNEGRRRAMRIADLRMNLRNRSYTSDNAKLTKEGFEVSMSYYAGCGEYEHKTLHVSFADVNRDPDEIRREMVAAFAPVKTRYEAWKADVAGRKAREDAKRRKYYEDEALKNAIALLKKKKPDLLK